MTIGQYIRPKNLEAIAEEYARARVEKLHPVSLGRAVLEIRTLMPSDTYTDKELAEIIAEKLIAQGHAIDFDLAVSGDEWRGSLASD